MMQQKLKLSENIPYDDQVAMQEDQNGLKRFYYEYFHNYYEDVYRIILGKVNDPECARDILQETLIKALEKRGQLKQFEKAKYWLFTIANNVVNDYFRKEQQRRLWVKEDETGDGCEKDIPVEDMTFNAVCKNSDVHILIQCLSRLPEHQQSVIRMHHIAGMKFSEIAEQTNVSVNTIASWYYRGFRKLKKWLEEEGGFSEDE